MQRRIAQVESGWQRRSPPLVATLSAAPQWIRRRNLVSAINQLQAFQNKVPAQVAPSDAALAATFLQAAQDIIDALSGGNTNLASRPHGRFPAARHQSNGQLQFTGERGAVYMLEASTNLLDWERIGVAREQADGTFLFEGGQRMQRFKAWA